MLREMNEESCSSEIVGDSDTDINNQEVQNCSVKEIESISLWLETFAGINPCAIIKKVSSWIKISAKNVSGAVH